MDIVILGTGCPKCRDLEKLTREVVADQGLAAEVRKEEDIVKIMGYGVMRTPGLVVDGKVLLSGRLPSREDLIGLLTS
jgi:small redox-active disulfide protein 2